MARGESISKPTNLSLDQRRQIFDRTVAKVTKHYFDPNFNGTEWPKRARESRDAILSAGDPDEFELRMHDLVRSLKTSHTGFFHQSVRRVPGRLAIGASFRRAETEAGPRWVAQDVHEGGPAHSAGLRPLDELKSINGTLVCPPEQPTFAMGTQVDLVVRGQVGLDVSRAIDAALAELKSCDRLVLDLRGHLGGGLGVLRLMSHLTPAKLPIGYTITRRRAESGYDKSKLPKLDRLPTHLPNFLGVASMVLKFVGRDPSVLLVSEGLGAKKWHGRIVILVNEHTVSAGEMAAGFASENHLATIVGTETAGRLIPGSGFKVGHGYMLIMPKAEYITWKGHRFEGAGVKPDYEVPWSPEAFSAGKDNQLESAVQIVSRI